MARRPRTRKRDRGPVPLGRAYIQSTFNNTIVTLTDPTVIRLPGEVQEQLDFEALVNRQLLLLKELEKMQQRRLRTKG